MAECAVCGAVIAANEKLYSFCGYHVFAVELLTDPPLVRPSSTVSIGSQTARMLFTSTCWPQATLGGVKLRVPAEDIVEALEILRLDGMG
jgi:hypothetical protein